MNIGVVYRALAGVALLACAMLARAQAPVALEDYFKKSAYSQVELSPNGKLLAAIVPNGTRNGVVVVDLESKKGNVVAAYRDADIREFHWVNDKRMVYSLIDLQAGLAEQRGGGGLFAVDIDGSNSKVIAPQTSIDSSGVSFVWRHPRFVDTILDGSDDIMVFAGERNANSPDVYRYNTRTGVKKLLTFDNPGDGRAFWAHKGVVKAAMSIDEASGVMKIHLRNDENSKWRVAATFNGQTEPVAMMPVRFDEDGTLYVKSAKGRDTAAIFKWDMQNDKLGEMIASHNRFDLTTLRFDRVKKKVVGVFGEMDKATTVWVDEEWARWQTMVDSALPGKVNLLTRSGGTNVLVFSYAGNDPGTWFLLDPVAKKIEELVAARPWIKPSQQAEVQFIQYPARDGLLIPAYLTLPKGKDAKNLPLVVNVHGGPFVRGETYFWNPEDQFLASRGYAVLSINFRGTEGHGWKHHKAGWKQWGLAMQDDLNDGAEYLAKQGIVDKGRMCIFGGSYGGYAVMQGLVRDPDLWKCGVNIVGVTDLFLLQNVTWSDTSSWKRSDLFFDTTVGNQKTDKDQLEKTSPARHASKIKAPVLMAYGGGDVRVPLIHGETMRDAMRKNGQDPEFVVYQEEGHGFLLEKSRYDFYGRVEKFLAKNLAK